MIKNLLPEKLRKDKKTLVIICTAFFGIVFLFMSYALPDSGTENESTDYIRFSELENSTEKRLKELLESVNGAGKVKVSVSFECAEIYEYAKDEKSQGDGKYENEFVIREENGNDNGLVISVTAPKVRGVAVTCEGAGSASVKEEITGLVCAVLGIGANKVYVSQMKE